MDLKDKKYIPFQIILDYLKRGLNSMALVQCPICGKEISEKAPYCVHCQYPIAKIKEIANHFNYDCFSIKDGVLLEYNEQANNTPQYVIIPTGVKKIAEYVFSHNKKIEIVVLPEGIKEIEESAFCWDKSIRYIELPNSLERIGEEVFEGCENLKLFKLPTALNYIGKEAFYNCSSIGETIIIPRTVVTIGEKAFFSANNLMKVFIPDTVLTIEAGAFAIDEPEYFIICCEAKNPSAGWDKDDWDSCCGDYDIDEDGCGSGAFIGYCAKCYVIWGAKATDLDKDLEDLMPFAQQRELKDPEEDEEPYYEEDVENFDIMDADDGDIDGYNEEMDFLSRELYEELSSDGSDYDRSREDGWYHSDDD